MPCVNTPVADSCAFALFSGFDNDSCCGSLAPALPRLVAGGRVVSGVRASHPVALTGRGRCQRPRSEVAVINNNRIKTTKLRAELPHGNFRALLLPELPPPANGQLITSLF